MKPTKPDLNTIPNAVLSVWALQSTGMPVGSKTWEMIEDTINKYPDYFPWEHAYRAIPEEVHRAYTDEVYVPLLAYTPNEDKAPPIMQMLNTPAPVYPHVRTEQEFQDWWQTQCDKEEQRRNEEIAEETRRRKVWDKHYKKYNLKYRL